MKKVVVSSWMKKQTTTLMLKREQTSVREIKMQVICQRSIDKTKMSETDAREKDVDEDGFVEMVYTWKSK